MILWKKPFSFWYWVWLGFEYSKKNYLSSALIDCKNNTVCDIQSSVTSHNQDRAQHDLYLCEGECMAPMMCIFKQNLKYKCTETSLSANKWKGFRELTAAWIRIIWLLRTCAKCMHILRRTGYLCCDCCPSSLQISCHALLEELNYSTTPANQYT